MTRTALMLGMAAAALTLAACDKGNKANQPGGAQSSEAKKAAGEKTIAAGLDQNSRFFAAAKSAGLDATLAGPGPYTVLVPDDAAFAKLPKATTDSWAKPETRAQLTGVLTYHILPGTVLVDDIGKAIDNGKGKAVLATMGGGTLTATRDDDKIVLTDGAGTKATITQPDEKFSNGVVQRIDSVLMPGKA
ncbi:MAG: fasciclin domain-containing protein [Sphingomicrobium sp.]